MGTLEIKEVKMKAMDIRTAFQACTTKRKRKHPDTESNMKIIKIQDVNGEKSADHGEDNDIEVLSEVKNSAKHSEPDTSKSVCENGITDSAAPKEDSSKVDPDPDTLKSDDDGDDDISIQNHKNCDSDAEILDVSAEADSSALNTSLSSVNADVISPSKQSSPVSSSDSEPENEANSSLRNTTISGSDTAKTPNPPKRRRKMSPEEAKRREELRAQKLKEKELKAKAKEEERMRLLKEKEERRKQKELEKEEKIRLKQEKKEQEELRRQKEKEERQKKKDEEELRRQKEKEERQKKKDEEIRLKLELKAKEKKEKEEQKLKALEEKKKAEEEKNKEEEEKKRLQMEKERKAKEAFQNFFVKSGFSIKSPQPQQRQQHQSQELQDLQAPPNENAFRPFQVSKNMVLATIVPQAAQERFCKEELDKCLKNQGSSMLYIELLRSGNYKSITHKKEKKREENDDVILVVNNPEVPNLSLKAKLLQFCENVRPAYWGTWRKKSTSISPRHPFGKDNIFDYEVDSDEEWDEGGPGESLTGTEDEESEDDYEVDNEFFVPHGYLSAEEEGDNDDEDSAPADPEELKTRLKLKEKEFLSERKKKTVLLQPIIVGCFFEADNAQDIGKMESLFLPHSAEILLDFESLSTQTGTKNQATNGVGPDNLEKSSPDAKSRNQNMKMCFPDEAMPYLIQLVHGNLNNRQFLAREFQVFWMNHCKRMENNTENSEQYKCRQIPKSVIARTIKSISKYMKGPDTSVKTKCWWVEDSLINKYGLKDLPVLNKWVYTLQKVSDSPAPQIED